MRLIKTSFISSLGIITVAILLAIFGLNKTNGLLIVHLDQYRKVVLGTQMEVILTAVFGGVLVVINLGLARAFKNKEGFFATLLSISSIILSALIFIYVFAIISIN